MEQKRILESYDPLSLSTHYLQMKLSATKATLATATGFIYEHGDTYYLITNGHNVTRMNPETNQRVTAHIGFPDRIETKCMIKYGEENYMRRSDTFEIALYADEGFEQSRWFVHPHWGYKVDVIAVPVIKKSVLQPHIVLKAVNTYDFVNDAYPPVISDDIFILGYPLDIVDQLEFPIWKRGSIATEPVIDLDKMPKILVDTATRSGMSGSPVIYQRNGFHFKGRNRNEITDDSVVGLIRGFLGVYSGRIGAEDNFRAQLGIVWKQTVITEIIEGGVIGDIGFQRL